jgi:hypothetical protein
MGFSKNQFSLKSVIKELKPWANYWEAFSTLKRSILQKFRSRFKTHLLEG